MSDSKKSIADIKASIEKLRDEIKLKAHLGELETRDELDQLEKKWQTFITEYKPLLTETEKTAKSTSAALGLAADELKAGYHRIRKLF